MKKKKNVESRNLNRRERGVLYARERERERERERKLHQQQRTQKRTNIKHAQFFLFLVHQQGAERDLPSFWT